MRGATPQRTGSFIQKKQAMNIQNELFLQLSLFTSPVSKDDRFDKLSISTFDFIADPFSRVEATDGAVGIVADIQPPMEPQGSYLRLLERSVDLFRENVLTVTKKDGSWHCESLKSLDTLRVQFPSGHRVDARQLNRILRFFDWLGVTEFEMSFSNDPYSNIVLIPTLDWGREDGLIGVSGVIAPIYDDHREGEFVLTPLDEMPLTFA